ncbi:hypothetical protein LSH36_90g02038 [Paralvinella palmiformis]|uniref:Uncharacterized protein n=1 Tax=Paralvinella palmiformis TaxID=53620 RepID=A0AAD9K2C9_9ANNE|nr:hypothetical protein LSH36_90g02038 [Paralvinella palmiformis]
MVVSQPTVDLGEISVNMADSFARFSEGMISSGHESMHSFPSMHSLAKASPATSFIAETFITAEQVTNTGESDILIMPPDLDDFTNKLTADDARVLVDLLKLAVAGRAGAKGQQALSHVLIALAKNYPQVAEMLLELCVTELEDVAVDTESGAEGLRVEFDRQCSTERRHDPLHIMDGCGRSVSIRSGIISTKNVIVLKILT